MAGEETTTVYCDVTGASGFAFQEVFILFIVHVGRETRLPLALKGRALAPTLTFNYDSVDMGTVFMGSPHVYDLELRNLGAIAAVFHFREQDTLFGAGFTFVPSQGELPAGSSLTIKASMQPYTVPSTSNLGAIDWF
jgi:hypothetical protein